MLCFRVRGLGFSRVCEVLGVSGLGLTYSLHCTSFFGLNQFHIKDPKSTMETTGRKLCLRGHGWPLGFRVDRLRSWAVFRVRVLGALGLGATSNSQGRFPGLRWQSTVGMNVFLVA